MSVDERPRVLITGASSGIGLACAQLLSAQGWRVFAVARTSPDALSNAAIEYLTADVRSSSSVQAAVEAVLRRAGGLDAVVCNAGVGLFGSIEHVTLERAEPVWDTNVVGTLRTLRAALPPLRAAPRGRVVIVGSLAGRAPIPFQGHYSASKAAVEAIALSLRNELRGSGVSVSLVEPGDIHTRFNERTDWGDPEPSAYRDAAERCRRVVEKSLVAAPRPELVARVVARALRARRPRTRYTVGPDSWLVPMGRRLLPDWLVLRLIRSHFDI
jgi:NAD(P)-dependent dehydrogenase (short-subunit alcohol dehydrogenase family)